jgi:hypothetical protein
MAEVMALANGVGVSNPIKLAWILWFAWGLVQVGWYRRACVAASPVWVPPARPERPQRPTRAPQQEPVAQVLPFEPAASQPVWPTSPESEGAEPAAPADSDTHLHRT